MRRLAFLLLPSLLAAAHAAPCDDCARWNETQTPFRIYGNTRYVGVRGLSSILVSSEQGHILIDGDLPESAAKSDILVSTHPDASGLWAPLAKREAGDRDALVDDEACAKYVQTCRAGLRSRMAGEDAR